MKKVFILLLLLLSFALVSCGDKEDPKIYEGYVVDKIYRPGGTIVTVTVVGKTAVPITVVRPDAYYVVIYKDEKITKHKVTKSFYDNFDIGSYVIVGNENLEPEAEE